MSLDLAQGLRAALHVITMVESARRSTVEVEADRRWAWEMLHDLEVGALRVGVSVQLEVLDRDAATRILARAAELPADIIALGHSHRSTFDMLTGGLQQTPSWTARLLRS